MVNFLYNLSLTSGGNIYLTIIDFLEHYPLMPCLIIIIAILIIGKVSKSYKIKHIGGHALLIWLIVAFIIALTRLTADDCGFPFEFWNNPWYKQITWFILGLFGM